MELTEEQKERIRKNRERAYEIQRKRKLEKEQKEKRENEKKKQEAEQNTGEEKVSASSAKKQKTEPSPFTPLEDFEVGASEWCNKKEAKQQYCLPDGTLAVCEVKEKDNPHHKGWTPMKLYRRSELRERAHKRYGGPDGLIEERNKRRAKQLEKDMAKARSVFG